MKRLTIVILTIAAILSLIAPTVMVGAQEEEIPPYAPDPVTGGTLNPTSIDKYVEPLTIPPAMPRTGKVTVTGGKNADYYEIAVRQFEQEIVPGYLTEVWGYGSINHPDSFNYPAYTIEAAYNRPVRVKWINGLVDEDGNYLPHLLPVDQTLHWTNPPGGAGGTDTNSTDPEAYTGPVPMVAHLHGAHVTQDSDGYPEAWFLPAANDIPEGYASVGSKYDQFKAEAEAAYGQIWEPGAAVYQYPNDQRAATLWFHDHSLGMTRVNVYAGPAGFYLLRGGPDDKVKGKLPGPAPAPGDPAGKKYYEIPVVIQDRSFNDDGSLFYPDNRAFFEGLEPEQLQIPFIPEGDSDVSPIWNPEFFGNTMVVNGKTWPYQEVEQRRYRFRLLNASDSRFLILKLSDDTPIWQIGNDGGFLPAPVMLDTLLLAPAERADVIIDFTQAAACAEIILQNIGPDEPFGGGEPGVDFSMSNLETTGQVMQFRVIERVGKDKSTAPANLMLPAITPISGAPVTRTLSLNELSSETVYVIQDEDGNIVQVSPDTEGAEPFGPQSAMLGTYDPDTGETTPLPWMADITEQPLVNQTEIWEIRNFTADAHPIHLHQTQFEVIERVDQYGVVTGPEPGETGFKDTVIVYPGDEGDNPGITRIKVKFDIAGLYVWHCHILSHEDNEMMRPLEVIQP